MQGLNFFFLKTEYIDFTVSVGRELSAASVSRPSEDVLNHCGAASHSPLTQEGDRMVSAITHHVRWINLSKKKAT